MSVVSSTTKSKKQVICYVPTSNQFEQIKPIEVKCFPEDDQTALETDKQKVAVTATIVTTVPQRKRPASAPLKKQTVPTITTDTTGGKPVRHLAVLPSSKERLTRGLTKHATNLSETFTMYEGPTTTPTVGRSLDDTITMNDQIPINVDVSIDDTNLCDNTTLSSICELIDQPKLRPRPHSLIGRYQSSRADTPSKTTPAVHIATVHYGGTQPTEPVNKQILIQQFYSQLEKMKATFNTQPTELPRQITTNTLTFDNGQVKQTCATNQLKEKTVLSRVSSATVKKIDTKPPVPQKQRTTKTPSARIQSAPVAMSTRSKTEIKRNSISSCKQHRNETVSVQPKKHVQTKEKAVRRVESAPPNRIDIHGPEVTLLPQDEEECRRMYEKLQRLQPNGPCVDMNTLRRALYPPIGTTAYSANLNHDQTSAFKSYRQLPEEMPQSWVKVDDRYMPKQESKSELNGHNANLILAADNTNMDRIVDQVKKHAAINYSYYTRTK